MLFYLSLFLSLSVAGAKCNNVASGVVECATENHRQKCNSHDAVAHTSRRLMDSSSSEFALTTRQPKPFLPSLAARLASSVSIGVRKSSRKKGKLAIAGVVVRPIIMQISTGPVSGILVGFFFGREKQNSVSVTIALSSKVTDRQSRPGTSDLGVLPVEKKFRFSSCSPLHASPTA
uniref:Putative secreted protein n=1 Tax=Anopheles darlingi TaxID=43151 RepID=A0A2M4DCV8_ANODA